MRWANQQKIIKMISTQQDDNMLLLKLDHSKTNAINLDLVKALTQTIQEVKTDPEITSLVLTSTSDKFFSIGFDIPTLINLSRSEFENFYLAFNLMCLDLYTLPKPTFAAITGHAIAGGTILALCCDYRFIARGRKLMGLNEIKLGVPVPFLADCVLHSIVGSRAAQEIMERGEFFNPDQARQLNLVDQILPAEDLLPTVIEEAKILGSSPTSAFAMIKQNRVEMIEDRVRKNMKRKADYFISCWYSPAGIELLRMAMEKF
jgi:enoyl-CoA hydratase/carnithine racemase